METIPTEKSLMNDDAIQNQLTRQVAKGGGIALVGQFIGKVIKFFFEILLTNVLGARTYGLYSLGISTLGITQTISQMGLHNGVVRFGSIHYSDENHAKLKGTLLSALAISFTAGILFGALLYSFSDLLSVSFFHEPELGRILKLLSISLPFSTVMMISAFAARIFRRMEFDAGLRFVVHPALLWIISGLALWLGSRVAGVVFGFVLSSIISALVGILILIRLFPALISDLIPIFENKEFIHYSLSVLLVGISSLLVYRIDRIMLGNLGGAADLGIYNAAAVLAGQTTIFLGSFNSIFSPIISDLHHRGEIYKLNYLYKSITKWVFSLTYPITLMFVFFPDKIMGIYGKDFSNGGIVLIVLGLAQLCNAAVGSAGLILTMSGRQKLELLNQLLLGGINISLNLILIQRYGILGAAFATGTSITLINLVRLIEVYIIFGIHPYNSSYWKPIFSGALSGGLFLFVICYLPSIDWLWVLGLLFFLVLYGTIFLLLGISEQEKMVVNAIMKKIRRKFSNN